MKKITTILLTGMVFAGVNQANAQIQKGNIMVGGDLAGFKVGLQKGASVNLSIQPKLGYFVKDNIALGGYVNIGVDYAKSRGTTVTYGIGAFGRYYVSDPRLDLLKHTRFFGEANVGIGGANTKKAGEPSITTNGLEFGVGPGVAYFITPNIGLEALVKYNLIAGFGSTATSHTLGFNLGFQIYLPTKKARAIYKEVEGEVEHKMKKHKKEKEESED